MKFTLRDLVGKLLAFFERLPKGCPVVAETSIEAGHANGKQQGKDHVRDGRN
jgi:hypothetical protein